MLAKREKRQRKQIITTIEPLRIVSVTNLSETINYEIGKKNREKKKRKKE